MIKLLLRKLITVSCIQKKNNNKNKENISKWKKRKFKFIEFSQFFDKIHVEIHLCSMNKITTSRNTIPKHDNEELLGIYLKIVMKTVSWFELFFFSFEETVDLNCNGNSKKASNSHTMITYQYKLELSFETQIKILNIENHSIKTNCISLIMNHWTENAI